MPGFRERLQRLRAEEEDAPAAATATPETSARPTFRERLAEVRGEVAPVAPEPAPVPVNGYQEPIPSYHRRSVENARDPVGEEAARFYGKGSPVEVSNEDIAALQEDFRVILEASKISDEDQAKRPLLTRDGVQQIIPFPGREQIERFARGGEMSSEDRRQVRIGREWAKAMLRERGAQARERDELRAAAVERKREKEAGGVFQKSARLVGRFANEAVRGVTMGYLDIQDLVAKGAGSFTNLTEQEARRAFTAAGSDSEALALGVAGAGGELVGALSGAGAIARGMGSAAARLGVGAEKALRITQPIAMAVYNGLHADAGGRRGEAALIGGASGLIAPAAADKIRTFLQGASPLTREILAETISDGLFEVGITLAQGQQITLERMAASTLLAGVMGLKQAGAEITTAKMRAKGLAETEGGALRDLDKVDDVARSLLRSEQARLNDSLDAEVAFGRDANARLPQGEAPPPAKGLPRGAMQVGGDRDRLVPPAEMGQKGTPGFTAELKTRADLSEMSVAQLKVEARARGVTGKNRKALTDAIVADMTARAEPASFRTPEGSPVTTVAAVDAAKVVDAGKAPKIPDTPEARLAETDPDVLPRDVQKIVTNDPEEAVVYMMSGLNVRPVTDHLGRTAAEVGVAARRVFGEVVGRLGTHGGAAAKQAQARAAAAIDSTKKYQGEMSDTLDVALKSLRNPKRGLDTGGEIPVAGETYTLSRLKEMVEGRIAPPNPKVRQVVEQIRDVVEQRGRLFEKVGLQQQQPDGSYAPFQVKGREILPTAYHPQFYAVIKQSRGHPARRELARVIATMNGMPEAEVARRLDTIKQGLDDMSGRGLERSAQAEFSRSFDQLPASIKVGRHKIPILETNPFAYLQNLVARGAARAAVVEHFGQDVGKGSTGTRLRDAMVKRGGAKAGEDFALVMRHLHGLPQDLPLLDSGSALATTLQGVKVAEYVLKQGLLSASGVVNIPEPLGNIRGFAGNRGLARAFGQLVRAIPGTLAGKQTILKTLEHLGSRSAAVMNTSYDPRRPVMSLARMAGELAGRVFGHRWINEGQEALAAIAALNKVEAFRKRGAKGRAPSERDVFRLRRLGYDEATARRFASGGGTQAEYDAFIRNVPGRLMGGTSLSAERSWFEMNRIAKHGFAFQSYFHTIMRDAVRAHDVYARSMFEATRDRDWRKALAASRQMGEFYGGKAAQGAAATFLASTVLFHGEGAEAMWDEAEATAGDFIGRSLADSLVGGPYRILGKVLGGEDLSDSIFPVFAIRETVQAISGGGKYEGLTGAERADKFFSRTLPVRRIGASIMASVGFGDAEGQRQHALASRTYWRWRYREKPPGDYTPTEREAIEVQRRVAFARAKRAAERGASPAEIEDLVKAALGVEGAKPDSFRRSVMASRWLDGLSEEEKASLKAFAPSQYPMFERHDRILEGLARSIR